MSRSQKKSIGGLYDFVLTIATLWIAYSFRHGSSFSDIKEVWYVFLVVPVFVVIAHHVSGVYQWVIRTSDRKLIQSLFKTGLAASLCLLVLLYFFPLEEQNPRSMLIIFAALQVLGTIAPRLVWQSLFNKVETGRAVAIYGAGDAGQRLAVLLGGSSELRAALFLDDNPSLQGTLIGGIPVMVPDTSGVEVKNQLDSHSINTVILAIPSSSNEQYRRRLDYLNNFDVAVQTLPSLSELIANRISREQIRDVSIADILGRSEVTPDPDIIQQCVRDRNILVTGGGGSIGSELCRQISRLGPKRLVIVDHSEENLYKITEEINQALKDGSLLDEDIFEFNPVLMSVKDRDGIAQVMTDFGINTVYHAAAYKHVPIIENQPEQGVEVNVFGTLNVLDAAIDANVSDFVLISTDKAVRPTNSMGATKRIAELCLQARASTNPTTRISMVRFGNVLGSSGSVVPKFKEQLNAGQPITITHPDITRYFMTIPEAAQLVLQASAVAKGGDVFVLDMGEPVKIVELAKTMVRLAGLELAEETGDPSDVQIEFTGLRPGEKMYEELFIGDGHKETRVQKVFTADEVWMDSGKLAEELDNLRHGLQNGNREAIREQLLMFAFFGQDEATEEVKPKNGISS